MSVMTDKVWFEGIDDMPLLTDESLAGLQVMIMTH